MLLYYYQPLFPVAVARLHSLERAEEQTARKQLKRSTHDIADLNAREGHQVLITKLDKEHMDSALFAVDDHLSVHHTVSSHHHVRWPPLHRVEGRCIKDPLFTVRIVRRRGLQSTHIGAVTELGLRTFVHFCDIAIVSQSENRRFKTRVRQGHTMLRLSS
eukprot:SAG31_NODE_733_length_12491_cov_7.073112_15_plen_160_part_00